MWIPLYPYFISSIWYLKSSPYICRMKSRNLNSSNINSLIPISCTARMSVSKFPIQMNRRQNHFPGFWNEVFQRNTEKRLNFVKLWNWRGGSPQNPPSRDLEGITCLRFIFLSFLPTYCTKPTCQFHQRDTCMDSLICPHSRLIS